MKQYICIDIGGTEIKHGVLDENEKFLAKGKVPTEAFKGGPALLKKVLGIAADYLRYWKAEGICVSTAGMVDVEKVRDIIDDIRLNMPAEIRQAKAIVQDRADIVESAKKEAEAIVKRAEDRARAMVAQEAIVKAAQQKATEILTSAQSQSREMRTTVTNYCENMLRHTEEQLAKSMTEVKTVRSTLRQSGKKATVRPAAQPQKPE